MSDLEDLEGRARPVVEGWCWEISEERWLVNAREEEDWGVVFWDCFRRGLP